MKGFDKQISFEPGMKQLESLIMR